MCGICATFGFVDESLIKHMLEKIHHRGEDHTEMVNLENIATLGFNRLSIVDLDGGNQPLSDANNEKYLICNGEIYNHQAIRDTMNSYPFKSKSDAEVILPLYERYGLDCVKHIDGMFAFVLVDLKNKTFVAARDPLGVKPIFYARTAEGWVFASEMKAFVNSGIALDQVHPIPPGSYLTTDGNIHRYFHLGVNKLINYDPDHTKLVVMNAVKKRLMADVKIGTLCSGGIDSSIVTAIAAYYNPNVEAFTVGVKGSPDVEYAIKVCQHLGIKHHISYIDLDMVKERIEKTVWAAETYSPLMVCESLLIGIVAENAKKNGVKVLLSGTGADEVFCGYPEFLGKDHGDSVDLGKVLLDNFHYTENRMLDLGTMMHCIEAREPFLDPAVIEHGFSLPLSCKLKEMEDGSIIEKYSLRKSFEGMLPGEVLWRKKDPFYNGSGMTQFFTALAAEISDEEFAEAKLKHPKTKLTNKAVYYLYKIFTKFYGEAGAERDSLAYYPFGDEEMEEKGSDEQKLK